MEERMKEIMERKLKEGWRGRRKKRQRPDKQGKGKNKWKKEFEERNIWKKEEIEEGIKERERKMKED